MKQTEVVKVENCAGCPHLKCTMSDDRCYHGKNAIGDPPAIRVISSIHSIPDWCPLPDYQGEVTLVDLGQKVDLVLDRLRGEVVLFCPRCGATVRHPHSVTLPKGITTIHCPGCTDYFEVEVRP